MSFKRLMEGPVLWLVKLPPEPPLPPWAPVHDLVVALQSYILQMTQGNAAEDCLSVRAPAAHLGDSDAAPGSWLQPGSALTIAVTWGVDQRMEGLSVSLSLPLSVTLTCKINFFKVNGKWNSKIAFILV